MLSGTIRNSVKLCKLFHRVNTSNTLSQAAYSSKNLGNENPELCHSCYKTKYLYYKTNES